MKNFILELDNNIIDAVTVQIYHKSDDFESKVEQKHKI